MTFDEYKKEQLEDPEFAKAYDEIQPEMNTIHNHSSSMPPSINDFNTYHQRGYGISLVICHDGTIYQYRSEQWVREKLCDMYVASSIMEGYDEREAQIIALNKIKENHKIDFWEVNADE